MTGEQLKKLSKMKKQFAGHFILIINREEDNYEM